MKKELSNGYINGGLTSQNSIREVRDDTQNKTSPVTIQPRLTASEFYREIQTTVPILAPEVLAAFANSQIFNDHAPSKLTSPCTSPPAGVHHVSSSNSLKNRTDANAAELLKRLEGESWTFFVWGYCLLMFVYFFLFIFMSLGVFFVQKIRIDPPKSSNLDVRRASDSPAVLRHPIPEIVEEKQKSDDKLSSIDGVSTNPSKEHLTPESYGSMKVVNKNLQLEAPYFSFRPASENDIFAITNPNNTNVTRISQTPEVPSVSFNALPKNYLDTPCIGEYCESKSLYEIQTAGINQQADLEKYSMPRYYSKSHLFTKHQNSSNESVKDGDHRTPKRIEKSRRLKNLRMQLPPLMIGLDKSKEGKSTRG